MIPRLKIKDIITDTEQSDEEEANLLLLEVEFKKKWEEFIAQTFKALSFD